MNIKTVIFLCELMGAKDLSKENRDALQQLMSNGFKQLIIQRYPFLSGRMECLTPEAVELRQELDNIVDNTQYFAEEGQLTSLLDLLKQHDERFAELENYTRAALSAEKVPPLSSIHILDCLALDEQGDMLRRQVRIQLYRLLVLGGQEVLEYLVPPPDENDTAALVAYYHNDVLPLMEQIRPENFTDHWAFRLDNRSPLGGVVKLPSYCMATPDLTLEIVPGRYYQTIQNDQRLYQGRGAITNISPDNVLQAVRGHIITWCTVQDVLCTRETSADPLTVLDEIWAGRFFLIEPYNYFSVASYAMDANALDERRAAGWCLCCGDHVLKKGYNVCDKCFAKLTATLLR